MAGNSAKVKFKIESQAVRELATRLALIDRKVARAALKAGVNEATRLVMWAAKSLVPRRSGQLRKSLGRKVKVYRGGAVIAGIIGPRRGFRVQWKGRWIDPVNYAHLVEYGRREVVPTKKKVLADKVAGKVFGSRVRSVPPRPFLRPAWEQNKDRAVSAIVAALNDGLRKFLAKRRSGGRGA
jgi:HK97 gp10 family phage protein